MSSAAITLTTDFGLSDPYAGQMKAVLLAMAPDTRVIDITHEIAPQAVSEAAFVLETSWHYFPPGTVHVVVVDPGVGTSRRRLAVNAHGHVFVGPDNGCLSAVVANDIRGLRRPEAGYETATIRLPSGVRAHAFERLELLPRPSSATFQGRDVFAPMAALLAGGSGLERLGPAVHEMLAFPSFRGPHTPSGIDGMVIRVDRYGNLITDVRSEDLRPGAKVLIATEELRVVRTYSEASGLAALVGSSGYLEVALRDGSASAALAAGPGTAVEVVNTA